MKPRTIRNVGIALAALWVAGTLGLAIAIKLLHGGGIDLDQAALVSLFGFVVEPPLVVWLAFYAVSEVLRWVRGAGKTTQGQDIQRVKTRRRAALIGVAVLLAANFVDRHSGPGDPDNFLSCNEQAVNTVGAEQARRDVAYDEAGFNAVMAVSNDKCMASKGYNFTGAGLGCMSSRSYDCYSRRWTAF